MDPTKLLGKVREQIKRENISRRKYSKKFDYVISDKATNIYDPKHINDILDKNNENNQSLIEECRCNRPKINAHLLKCLQNIKDQKEFNIELKDDDNINQNGRINKFEFNEKELKMIVSNSIPISNKMRRENFAENSNRRNLPTKSNAMIGWPKHHYYSWEKTTYYISPVYTMPGYKIADHPYNAIYIG